MNWWTRWMTFFVVVIMVVGCAGCAAKSADNSDSASAAEGTEGAENSAANGAGGDQGSDSTGNGSDEEQTKTQMEMLAENLTPSETEDWYGTTYEIFVYSFYDSDGDGIGDLRGIIEKADYLNDTLGVTHLWTTPIFASPTYHKYDVTDYLTIDPQFGTMEDFEALLAALHGRGVRWILDLPINHTSDQHPWFVAAANYLRNLPEGAEPSYEECPYVWYYHFAREAYDGYVELPNSEWFYEARFWSGMPDLNLDTENVRAELEDIFRFWLEKGADGFRLDAVTSYYTYDNEANIAFLTWVNDTVKSIQPEAYLVGEGWTDQNAYAAYYASGIDSMFDFAFAGQDGILSGLVKGTRSAATFAEAMAEEEVLYRSYGEYAINAPFYTNHDMARSTGYYAYDDGSRTKLAAALNLLMTGNAYVYYGEELGMKGSGKDENKRAPMYWSTDASAEGMCSGPPDMDAVSMKFGSYAEQADDPLSIFNYVRTAIRIRESFPVIARGVTIPADALENDHVAAFDRVALEGQDSSNDMQTVLIVINLSEEETSVILTDVYASYDTLSAVLTVTETPVSLENVTLTLPPFAVAVLTKSNEN